MSLKAWYPFDGNINNHGTGNLTLTQTTAPTYVAGKVTEKALSTGAFKWTAAQAASVFNNEAITIAFWYKALNSNTSGTLIFGNDSMTPPNNRKFTIFSYPSMNDLHWSWQNEASTTFTGGSINGIFPTGVWTHVCFTYQNPNGCVYINGELKKTFSGVSNSSSFAYDTKVLSSSANRYIQDLRVYDNCLTPREVKHLSQGLSLHYNLNSVSNPNLITTMSAGGRTTLNGKYGLNADFSQNVDTYGHFNVAPALELDKTYTLSFDVSNFPSGSVWTWQLWNKSAYAFTVKDNGHYSFTFTPKAATLPTDYSLTKFLFDDGTRTNAANVVVFSNFKIEEGDSDTAWCPHSTDAVPYSIFTKTSSIEHDNSGYRLNGTRNGTLIGSRDSGRYRLSTKFSGNQYISRTRISDSSETTISAWMKIDSYPSGYMLAFADHNSKVAFGFYSGTSAIISCGDSSNSSLVVSGLKDRWTLADWHMVTIVKNSEGYKFYFDGKLWSNYGTSNYWTASVTNLLTVGCRNNGSYANYYTGKMSDFRIYSTALSDAEIEELYSVATSYGEDGSLLTYEIEETNVANIKYARNETKATEFTEVGYTGGMKTKVLPDGSAWARIHWLDVTTDNTYFASNDEVAFCDKKNRFSKMGLVDYFKSYSIPKGYTKLQYIESTGTQYIDTGYYWTSEAVKIYMDAIVVSNSSNQSLFGNEEPFSGGRYFSIVPHGSNGSYGYYVGSNAPLMGGVATCTVGTRFNMECSTTSAKLFTVKVNGTTLKTATYSGTVCGYANTTSTNTTKGKIYIFANHNSSTSGAAAIQNVGGMKLYSFKMYDNGVLVRDFVPCKNTQGVVGLLDKVHNVFYTTPTSAAFTAGPIAPDSESETGVYEFMLTYPLISATGYNRWTQTSSPNESTVTGFKSIVGTWTQEAHSGIRKHGSACVYDCDSGGSWYAPIGQKSQWTTGKYIPAANGSSTTETELWVRIDNLPKLNKISMLENKYIQAFEIKEL